MEVEFEGKIAEEFDFDGIKQLLQQLLCRAPINTADLSNLIIGMILFAIDG